MPSSEPTTALAGEIAELFVKRNLTWKIGGSQRVPTAEDVQAVLDRAKFEIEYQAANSHLKNTSAQVIMRHLLFKQSESGKVEVFLRMGEIE
jgi:hypothetical protein